MKRNMVRKGFKKGFTLVELLFVMAVISILAGFGISQMSGSTNAAENTVAKGNVRSVITELQLQYAETQDYTGFTTDIDGITVTIYNSGKSFCVEGAGAVSAVDGAVKTYKFDSVVDSAITEGQCAGA